jgi:adenosine deaminase
VSADFIQALPKTETHLHVEGAIPYALLREWRPDQYPANPAFHAPGYRFPDFPTFEKVLLDHALPWFVSAERYHDAMKAIFATHVAQNVRYVETSFHLPVTQFINVPGPEIIAAIRAAVPPGLEVRIFAGMLRDAYQGPLQAVIDDLENWDDLAGVDLHGLETMPTEPWSAPVWARLRDAGKITKCHGGEFDGAARVREAIEVLGVTRVQHGVRAVEDPAVVALARDRGVTFDVCPISNIRLAVFPDFASHPLRRLSAAGVRCTISTDDPLCFNNSLVDEYQVLADAMNCTRSDLARYAANGWEVADVPSEFRSAQLAEIDRLTHAA